MGPCGTLYCCYNVILIKLARNRHKNLELHENTQIVGIIPSGTIVSPAFDNMAHEHDSFRSCLGAELSTGMNGVVVAWITALLAKVLC